MKITHNYIPSEQASLIILDESTVRVQYLLAKDKWNIGRLIPGVEPCPEICLSSAFVARNQGCIQRIEGQWFYIENPLVTNAALHNDVIIPRPSKGMKNPILLEDGDVIQIGDDEHSVKLLFTLFDSPGKWETIAVNAEKNCVAGRHAECDIVIDHPVIEEIHFSIRYGANVATIDTVSSAIRPLLNGKELHEATELHIGDCISILDEKIYFLGKKIAWPKRDRKKEINEMRMTLPSEHSNLFSVNIQSKKIKAATNIPFVKREKEVLRDICFDIKEGTLVGVVGTPGAGKTTLAYCLGGLDVTGISGRITCRGMNVLTNPHHSKVFVGFIPDYFHAPDTIRRTLQDIANLRYGGSSSCEYVLHMVSQTLKMLDLEKSADKHPSRLNFYERALLQIGCELVCGRNILFLDNFTQGINPNKAEILITKLQELSHQHGITIIHLLHDLSHIEFYDQAIILGKVNGVGRQFFSGTIRDAIDYFGVEKFTDICTLVDNCPNKFIST